MRKTVRRVRGWSTSCHVELQTPVGLLICATGLPEIRWARCGGGEARALWLIGGAPVLCGVAYGASCLSRAWRRKAWVRPLRAHIILVQEGALPMLYVFMYITLGGWRFLA